MGIIIAIIIAIVLFYLIKVAIKANKSNVAVDRVSPAEVSPVKPIQEIAWPPVAAGYFYNEMVGMYNIGITLADFGIYKGYAVAETNNPHDKFAVGIHRSSDNKLVGYIPREFRGVSNKELHESLLAKGGKTDVIFKISGSEHRTYGAVYIKE